MAGVIVCAQANGLDVPAPADGGPMWVITVLAVLGMPVEAWLRYAICAQPSTAYQGAARSSTIAAPMRHLPSQVASLKFEV
jgi:hypothetical protein